MSAHVLLNLLNELGNRDKMRGLPSILSLFCNEFNKFNKTRARMLASIYHMTLRLLLNLIFAVKNVTILSSCTQRCYGRQNISRKSVNHLWFIDFIAWCYFTPRHDLIWLLEILNSVHTCKKRKVVWSVNTTITHGRPAHGTVRYSQRTTIITRTK